MVTRDYLFSTAKITEREVLAAAARHNPALYKDAYQTVEGHAHDAQTADGGIAIEIKCNTREYEVDAFEIAQSFKRNALGLNTYIPNKMFETLDGTDLPVHLMIRRSDGVIVVYDMRAEEAAAPLRERQYSQHLVHLEGKYAPTKFVKFHTTPINTF